MRLYPFQKRAVKGHIESKYCLNFSIMGSGKSIMALETVVKSRTLATVFGPAMLQKTWEYEADRYGVNIRYVAYSMLHKVDWNKIPSGPSTLWICDEVHYLKNPKAKRTQAFYSALKTHVPEYFLGMSGTPIKNRVQDIWTLLTFINCCPTDTVGIRLRHPYDSYYRFSDHFAEFTEMRIRGHKVKRWGNLRPELESEFKDLLKGKYFRAPDTEVLRDLPSIVRKKVIFDINPPPEMAEDFEKFIKGQRFDPKSKSISALLKSAETVSYAKEILEEGEGPLLIYSDHVAPCKAIAEAFNAPTITGATNMHERARICERFQRGEIAVVVATIGALAVGVTLHRARHVIFNDVSWTPSDNDQAEKRIHRIGQTRNCVAHYLFASHIDHRIYETLVDKKTGGRRAIPKE